ncbi:shikimate kinase [Aequorivita sp. Q41]|uniref:shikimate kinase n=1 Tax=Aequorivita sp. Q41 TaxID=3153300 RepID=UPI0032425BAF
MKILLIGYMGSGKSSVGKKLAEKLKLPFKDMDSEIEKIEGVSIATLFSKKGEIYFRKIENKILKNLLSSPENFVLATGGGTPCYGDAMASITAKKDVHSFYLKTPLEILVKRLFLEKANRPLLAHLETEESLHDFIRKHLFERVFYYNQSKFVIENTTESVDTVVAKIVSKLF